MPDGIEEKTHFISLYPNPATNYISIESEIIPDKLQIVNVMGQVVQAEDCLEFEIDISNLSSGIYFVNVFKEDMLVASERLIVN